MIHLLFPKCNTVIVVYINSSFHKNYFNYRVTDLENALLEECSVTDIYCICKGKPLPDGLRSEIWQVSLEEGKKGH